MMLTVPQDEIDRVLDDCAFSENEGHTRFVGLTYEQGVKAALEWALGFTDVGPLDD